MKALIIILLITLKVSAIETTNTELTASDLAVYHKIQHYTFKTPVTKFTGYGIALYVDGKVYSTSSGIIKLSDELAKQGKQQKYSIMYSVKKETIKIAVHCEGQLSTSEELKKPKNLNFTVYNPSVTFDSKNRLVLASKARLTKHQLKNGDYIDIAKKEGMTPENAHASLVFTLYTDLKLNQD
ncbi:MAG: hypothetical protein HRT88_16600 [Lentisphaeraceae bacterium]|nr:hypothetical protein [Lentisphaeraceae bacterium]